MNTTRTLAIWMALGGTASASSTIAFDGGDWTTSCADTDIDDSDHASLEDAWDAVQDDCDGAGTVTGDSVSASIVHVTARSNEAMYLATTATSEDETSDIVAYLDNTRVFSGRSGRSSGFRLMADFGDGQRPRRLPRSRHVRHGPGLARVHRRGHAHGPQCDASRLLQQWKRVQRLGHHQCRWARGHHSTGRRQLSLSA